jgi:WhiB family redox-sensing transcriptional regulator
MVATCVGKHLTERYSIQQAHRPTVERCSTYVETCSKTDLSRYNDKREETAKMELPDVSEVPDWSDALCAQVDPELFFPKAEGNQRLVIESAKAICKECDLITECLTYALKHKYEGIWGGTTVMERQAMRKKAGRMRKSPTRSAK